jgi:hypothetical protein
MRRRRQLLPRSAGSRHRVPNALPHSRPPPTSAIRRTAPPSTLKSPHSGVRLAT